MSDQARMRLMGMRFFGRIGHTPEERAVGTHIEVDVELDLSLEGPAVHDLADTVDYRRVHDLVRDVVTAGEHPLLEGLAQSILDALEKVTWREATVRVRKERPPFEGDLPWAEIEIRRER